MFLSNALGFRTVPLFHHPHDYPVCAQENPTDYTISVKLDYLYPHFSPKGLWADILQNYYIYSI